jgi:hypothetical protein
MSTPPGVSFLGVETPLTLEIPRNSESARDTAGNDPVQVAADQAVAEMVRGDPAILTAPSTGIAAVAGVSRNDVNELVHLDQLPDRPAETPGELPERLQLARRRRTAFRSATSAIRLRSHGDFAAVQAAVAAADVAEIVKAVTADAVRQWADSEMGRPSQLNDISANLEHELVAAIYADPRTILANLPADDGIDAPYIRGHALAALTPSSAVFDAFGRPTLPRPSSLSLFQTMVSR